MSTTIDSRVVEMRFDNKHFESNVSTTMSTLEKLKQKLNLTGAAKGLENINTASKKVNIAGLGTAAETVGLKFNAMYTMADQALRNITNRVQNAAESMVKALTIDPVQTGLSEYETQINAVQTILANTQHNGTTLNEVNAALDTLNTYADKTIYNFTEMTRNIGTFTAAGVDLQTSVESIQGIANLAAVSGSTSQQASTAMYQLSQALAAGKVSLMDWNSVVNAGMGGKVFQDALVRTSELLKTGAKDAIATYGSFRESLTQGEWLTTEVLTETLKQLSGAYSEADLIAQGFTEDQAKEIAELAETATSAATKVKTFTQLWDTLKEAAQSGWTQTWELIIGDFEEAKELWSGISDVIGGFINKMSESRNNWLAEALNSPWEKLIDKINEAGIETEVFEEKVSQVAKDKGINVDNLVEKYGSLEKAFKSGAITTDILKTAVDGLSKSTADLSKVTDTLKIGSTGDQVKAVQQALSDLGYEFKKYGVDGIIGEETEGIIKAFQEANGLEVDGIIGPKTIAALEEASKNTNSLSESCKELWENFDELGGREKIIKSLSNIFVSLRAIFRQVGLAFRDVFPPSSENKLTNFINGFHELTTKLKPSAKTLLNLRKTLRGVFAVIDIVTTLLGGGFKIALKAVSAVLSYFDTDILSVTATIGDNIVKFRDWLDSVLDFDLAFETLADGVKAVIPKIQEFMDEFLAIPEVGEAIEKVKTTFSGFWEDIKSFFTGGFDGTAEDLLTGLANGIKEGASVVWDAIVVMAEELVAKFCDVMGICSPSTRMFELGQFIVKGLVNGIKAAIHDVTEAVTWLGTNIYNFFAGIDWSGIFGAIQDALSKFMDFLKGVDWSKFLVIIPIGVIGFLVKMLWDFVTSITNAIDGFRNIEDAFAEVLISFGKTLKSYGMKLKAEALNTLVNAIVKLVAAVIVLSYVPIDQVYNAVGVLVILSALMIGITFAMDKLTKASIGFEKGKGFNAEGFNVNILAIAGCMLIMAKAMQMIGNLSLEQFAIGLTGMILVMVVIIGILETCGNIVKAGDTSGLDKIGGMLIKVSVAMLLMAAVCTIAGSLSLEDALKGAAFMLAFVGFIALLTQATRITKQEKIAKLGGLLIAISVAMMLMVSVCKLAGTLSETEIAIGAAFMLAFVGFVYMLTQATKNNKETDKIAKLGGTILAISVALLLMVGMCKLAGMLSLGDVLAGAAFMAGYAIFIKALVGILKIGKEEEMARVAGTLIAMSIAIGILAGIAVLLSFVPAEGLAKGVAVVSVLGIIMAIMTKSLKGANNVLGSIVGLAVAVAVMAGAVAALTFLDGEKMAGAVLALSIVMTAFGSMAKKAGQMNKCMGTLIVMAVMVGILGGVLYLLAGLPIESTIGSAIAMSILLNFVTKAMKTLKTATPLAKGSILSLVAMTAVLVLLGAAVKLLQWMNIDIGIGQAVALSILLIALSQATKILSTVGPVAGQAAMGAVALAAVIIILGGLVAAVGGLVTAIPQVEEFLDRGIPVLTKIGQALGGFIGGFIGGIAEGAMASFPGICDSIAQGMVKIGTIDSTAIEGGKALIEAMALMAGANIADTFSQWITLGKDPMLTFKENVLAFAGAMVELSATLTSGGPINSDLIDQLASSGTAFATLNQSLPRSGGWIDDIVGAKDLGTFGESVKAFATAMIDINTSVSGEGFSFNEEAMTAMCTAGTKFVELNESLPKTGGWVQDILGEQDLTNFGNSVVAFAGAMIDINASVSNEGFSFNEEAMTAMCTAGTKFVELNNSLPSQDGWIQDILGSKELGDFGDSVVAFADAMIAVNTTLDGVTINEGAFTALATAGTEINKLQTELPKEGGWQQTIMGSENIALFGTKVAAFAAAMIEANTALADVTINTAAFESIVTAGEKVNDLQSVLPKEGGWWQEITGKTDIEGFGEKVVAFAGAMAGLRDALGDEGISDSAVTSITKAGDALVALNDTLPEKGWFDTKEDLSDFSTHITNFSTSLTDFNTMASGLNADGIETAMSTATRMKEFIDTLATIDTSGITKFTGVGTGGVGADGPLADIGAAMNVFSEKVAGLDTTAVSTAAAAALKLKTLINGLVGLDISGVELFKPEKIGSAMKTYSDKVAGIDTAVVSSSVTSANRLKTFISGLAGIDTSGVEKFKLGTIGSTLKAYSGHVSSMDFGAVSSSISSANRLRNFVASLAGLDTSGVGSFTSAIDKLGTISIDSVVKAFSGSTSKLTSIGSNIVDALTKGMKNKQTDLTSTVTTLLTAIYRNITDKLSTFKTAGSKIMDEFITGLSSKKSKISSTITTSLSSAVTSARNYYDSFYSAGSYLVSGFASGISANTWRAEAKAKAMANAAEKAAKEALDINSPSKVFAAIGSGVVEGFVKGIDDNVSDTDIAVSNMADVARNGFSNAISKINDFFNSDLDTQPTIRPVLDLTEVETGAGAIAGMFGMTPSVGVLSNVGTINSMMNDRIQNGGNTDVVSAINKLRKDLGNVGGTSYNINGITYDDGTNVSEAVKSIVRAARVERRI